MGQNKYWDSELKPFLVKLHEKFETVDKLSQHHLGSMIYYVEHDLADGRDPRFRTMQCQGVFNTKSFQDIEEFVDIKDDIIKAGQMINKFVSMES